MNKLTAVSEISIILKALSFAAYKHRAQRRKDVNASRTSIIPLLLQTFFAMRVG